MSKSSRPDIQVLEDRVSRLKSQLLEYQDLRIYSITRKRLSSVAEQLEECVEIIREVTYGTTSAKPVRQELREFVVTDSSEFNEDDGDLSDLFQNVSSPAAKPVSDLYTPKQIVSEYSRRLQMCSEISSGIIQVNQFAALLNSWFQTRFPITLQNPSFKYNASRLHEWVDLLILAAGESLHHNEFPAFKSELDHWIADLNTLKDEGYILPYSVVKIRGTLSTSCTKEAVLLEKIIKSTLYDSQFYPEEINSVERIVIENSGYTKDDLTVSEIVENCSNHFICTSSFDLSKYDKEEV